MAIRGDEVVLFLAEGHSTEYRIDDGWNHLVGFPLDDVGRAGCNTALVAAEDQVYMMSRYCAGSKCADFRISQLTVGELFCCQAEGQAQRVPFTIFI